MTALPTDFHFSQGSLQDYVDCQRRFQLRYLRRLDWPAVEAEPALENEQRLQAGAAFHHLVHQHLIGVPEGRLSEMVAASTQAGQDLGRWWQNFLLYGRNLAGLAGSSGKSQVLGAELVLSASLQAHRLVAKYDAIVSIGEIDRPKVVIFDWKTSHLRPSRLWLAERLQTRIYPYLLAQAGAFLNGGEPIPVDQIEMVYWFTGHPQQPESFLYSRDQYQKDGAYLAELVAEIADLPDESYYLTPHPERCQYCTYRSLCDRGARAGDLDQAQANWESLAGDDLRFDFEQVAEIEF